MGWLGRLFGRKGAGDRTSGGSGLDDAGPDGRRMQEPREFMGKPMIDMRPDWEVRMADEVHSDLGGEDEQYAQKLCELLRSRDEGAAREIGETLYANGGHKRMVRVCLRVKALGGDARTLERYAWDGVGEWRG